MPIAGADRTPKRRVLLDNNRRQCWIPNVCTRHGLLLTEIVISNAIDNERGRDPSTQRDRCEKVLTHV
jgi:hypothetical protein